MTDQTIPEANLASSADTGSAVAEQAVELLQKGENVTVSGGAGSGKTHTLKTVLERLLAAAPHCSIACITYTNAAALEIRQRVSASQVKICTIHSFLWDLISPFQHEIKEQLLKHVADFKSYGTPPSSLGDFKDRIEYGDFCNLADSVISHDELIILAAEMFAAYDKLRVLLHDCWQYILVDEYQDSKPPVIEFLLTPPDHHELRPRCHAVAFFGDPMQSLYIEAEEFRTSETLINERTKILWIEDNHRNSQPVIDLANRLRSCLYRAQTQMLSPDNHNSGKAIFLYSDDDRSNQIRTSDCCKNWPEGTWRELRLTHRVNAQGADFVDLFELYNSDPVTKINSDLRLEKNRAQLNLDLDALPEQQSYTQFLESLDTGIRGALKINDKKTKRCLDLIDKLELPASEALKIHLNKEMLLDYPLVVEGSYNVPPQRSLLIEHLVRLRRLSLLYHASDLNGLLQASSFELKSLQDKTRLVV